MKHLVTAEHDRSGAMRRSRAPPSWVRRSGEPQKTSWGRRIFGALLSSALLLAMVLVAGCSGTPDAVDADCEAVDRDLAPLLHSRWSDITGGAGGTAVWNAAQHSIERMLVPHDQWIALGWCSLRAQRVDEAERAFQIAIGRVRHSAGASIGLGYIELRRGHPRDAAQRFAEALVREPDLIDARQGLRIALRRLPPADATALSVRDRLQELATHEPSDTDLQYLLAVADRKAGGPGEFRNRGDATPGPLRYFARSGADYLEVVDEQGRWEPIFVKGVNIGPATPGRFPSESPEDEATWADWLAKVEGLGANAVRVYTLQPPAFYRALARHNAGRGADRLWLLQGVWADLPPGDDFDDLAYLAAFRAEIARVIDAVHGDLVLEPVRGHARGVFDTDVSRHTLAWVIGREWEPFAVVAFEKMHPGGCVHAGRFVRVESGRPMECWIARTLDYAAEYEAQRHGAARPLTFASWPTLDPLTHPTEATRDEEDALRLRLDGTPLPVREAPAWDDDAATVDASRMSGTGAFPPGVFASYHIYPNFPYFINLDPSYGKVRDKEGVNRYAGYLRELKAHHGRQPVLVAEFGMSTSRGVAHLQPEGLHHGGHDERFAMRQNVRLLNAIHKERMAGGVAFEFMDEWFKSTWPTGPFEIPEERRPFWFNFESAEQSYGLFAMRPRPPVRVDGNGSDWASLPTLAAADTTGTGWSELKSLKATYDAGWVYVLLQTAGRGAPDWSRLSLAIGLDTYAAERGERRLPAPADCSTQTGVEFAAVLRGPGRSELLVTPTYLQRHPSETGRAEALYSPSQPSGRFVQPSLQTNRERFGRDGTRYAPRNVAPGRLRFGSLDPKSVSFDTRTDVAVGTDGVIEIRLPWGLLNFADPTASRVLHSVQPADVFDTLTTTGISFYACAADTAGGGRTRSLPAGTLTLRGWEQPAYVMEPKHGLSLLRVALAAIPDSPRVIDPETAR